MTPVTELLREPVCQAEAFSGHRGAGRRSGDDTIDDPRRGPRRCLAMRSVCPGPPCPIPMTRDADLYGRPREKVLCPSRRLQFFFARPSSRRPIRSGRDRSTGRKSMVRNELRFSGRRLGSPQREAAPNRESCQNGQFFHWDTWYRLPLPGSGATTSGAGPTRALPLETRLRPPPHPLRGRLTHPVSTWNTPCLLRDAVAIIGGPGNGGVRAADATMNPVPRGSGIGRAPDACRLPR